MATAGKKLLKSLSNPYFLALLFSIPACFYFSRYFSRYDLRLTFSSNVEKQDGVMYYYDLDNDGYSEEIISFTDTKGGAAYKITDRYGKIINSAEFNGIFTYRGNRLIFGDYDRDGVQEIYVFYIRNDSLLLSATEFSTPIVLFIDDRFIANLSNELDVIDCSIWDAGLQDLDNNGSIEIIFSVSAGFPVYPRNVFIYEIENDSLEVSPFTGGTIRVSEVYDFDRDGKKELFTISSAPSNMNERSGIGLHDSSAWLIVLDERLQFEFPPHEFKGYATSLESSAFRKEDKGYIGAIMYRKVIPNQFTELCIFDEKGNLLNNKVLPDSIPRKSPVILPLDIFKDCFAVIDHQGMLVQYDQDLKMMRKRRMSFIPMRFYLLMDDLDQDGRRENIFYNIYGNVAVSRFDLSSPALLNIPPENKYINACIKRNGDKPAEIMLQSDRFYYYISYFKNPLFIWQYPLYLFTFILFYLLIYLILYFQRVLLRDKYNAEKKISELQLMMVKDQLDPHFMFNAMNTINSLVVLKKPEEAQQRILGLSRLMRTMVESSGKIAQSLDKEIEFTRNYLDFQKNRYVDLFNYQIDIDAELDLHWQIPRMVIQILVENSIKHGLLPKGKDGILKVMLKKDAENILVVVEDNGIGREAARKNLSGSTGKGLLILEQNFKILNQYNSEKAKFEIGDIYLPDQSVAGTRITLVIPIKLNYRIYER